MAKWGQGGGVAVRNARRGVGRAVEEWSWGGGEGEAAVGRQEWGRGGGRKGSFGASALLQRTQM